LSLTGWYYHLSRYGEDLLRPTLAGIVIIFLSTIFWLMQSDPTLAPSFSTNATIQNQTGNFSTFIGLNETANAAHWQKAFERSIADFIPLLPLESNSRS
jgi:hypothetical protein